MKILTVENKTYDIDCVPDEIDDIHECIYSIISKISTEAILNTKLSLH